MVEILPLKPAHAKAIAHLHAKCFSPGWPRADFEGHILSSADDVLGAAPGNELHGFIIMRCQFDQAEVLTIAVDSARRGHGLGAQLLQAGETAAMGRGAKIVFLEVAKDNSHAVSLYESAGYQRCGVRPGYYKRTGPAGRMRGRVDALLFQKQL